MDQQVQPKKRTRKLSKKDRKRMSNYFTEYCDATSIHGFRYLGEQKRSCLEKLWWFITIFISVCICTHLIIQTYNKWDRSPVIVSFATKQTPIWQIPFPAVTICPETKIRQSVFNFTEMYLKDFDKLSENQKMKMEYISMVCKPRRLLKKLQHMTFNTSVLDFLEEIGPRFDNMTLKCLWMGNKLSKCSDQFTPVLTDTGICYTFNMLDREELYTSEMQSFTIKNYMEHRNRHGSMSWSLEKGYGKHEDKDTYPRRALYAGAKNGMDITLVTYDEDIDYICGDALQGYKILLHHPAEIPSVSQQYFLAPLNEAVLAGVKPDMMMTAEELRSYSPWKRQCFFPLERRLRYFKVYTQQNCEIECLANYTLQLCGCVPFHMPRAAQMPICGPPKIDCMKFAENKLLSGEIDFRLQELKEEALNANNDSLTEHIAGPYANIVKQVTRVLNNEEAAIPTRRKSNCDCLQSCTSLNYNVETSQSNYDWVQHMTGMNDPYAFIAANIKNGTRLAHMTRVVLFFKDMQFIASERDELYGHIDFLANCGGLLGLFTGFSFISLVEIIYFLSLRLLCNMKNRAKKRLSGENNDC